MTKRVGIYARTSLGSDRQDITRQVSELKQIVKNTGKSADLVIEKISAAGNTEYGYDARAETFGDMYELGVIDPLKVVRCALQNASSAATLLLTLECAMVEQIENH